MHTFTQQQKRSPQRASFDITSPNTAAPAASRLTHDFSRTPVYAPAPLRAQAKLKVSTPGDEYEQEADRVADRVMHASEPQLQRACACGGECSKCKSAQHGGEGESKHVMRVRANDTAEAAAPPLVDEVLDSPGQPMDAATRAFFEPRFGHDFSQVRVHTDAEAARSAQSVGARAYTVGSHIVFGETFEPRTPAGRSLLAHELVHVVQQGAREAPGRGSVGVGAQGIGAALASPQVQRQVGGQEGDVGGGGATELSANGCYTCDMEGGVGICCYKDAPFDEGCFNVGKAIIDSCKDSSKECLRKAQCATCHCIGEKLGKQYCQCSGIV